MKTQIGKNMRHALEFINLTSGWHSYQSRCLATRLAIERLAKRGLIEKNEHQQFRKLTK